MMKRTLKLHLAFFALCLLGLASCSEDYTFTPPKISGTAYDPSKPVTIEKILPDSGIYLTQFVIQGSNFGTDKDKISVLFGNRKATVVSSNGTSLYGITPKQADGDNTVTISVDGSEPVAMATTFHYTRKELVTTISGKDQGLVDGKLSEARFGYMHGVGVITGNNIFIADDRNNSAVRMVSPSEDKVTTLMTGIKCGKPAVSKDGKKVYVCELEKPHKVWLFSQENSWMPKRITASLDGFDGQIYSLVIDDTDRYLYFRDQYGKLGRLDIENPANIDVISTECGPSNGTTSYMIWSPVDKCFFMTVQNTHGIYKISADGKNVEEWAGHNGAGNTDGPRLDAQFGQPAGMAVDIDGNLFICDSGNGCIRKLDHTTGMVSLVAGGRANANGADGDPIEEARFNFPYDLSMDSDGNFYIVEGWGHQLRRYAIE